LVYCDLANWLSAFFGNYFAAKRACIFAAQLLLDALKMKRMVARCLDYLNLKERVEANRAIPVLLIAKPGDLVYFKLLFNMHSGARIKCPVSF
jgi:hypothetical protein